MSIEIVDNGFIQYYDNKIIEKIYWFGESVKIGTEKFLNFRNELIDVEKFKFHGDCTVHYSNKQSKKLRNIDFCSVYNSQYGIPVSNNGKTLFVGSWDRTVDGVKKGLVAHDIESDSVLWRFHQGRIRQVFVYDNYIVALKAESAILKFNIDNGEILGQVKATTIEDILSTGTKYVITQKGMSTGQLNVIDTERMVIVKKYSSKTTDPYGYLACIDGALLQGNTLTISGWEKPPNWSYAPEHIRGFPFERVIDTNFNAET